MPVAQNRRASARRIRSAARAWVELAARSPTCPRLSPLQTAPTVGHGSAPPLPERKTGAPAHGAYAEPPAYGLRRRPEAQHVPSLGSSPYRSDCECDFPCPDEGARSPPSSRLTGGAPRAKPQTRLRRCTPPGGGKTAISSLPNEAVRPPPLRTRGRRLPRRWRAGARTWGRARPGRRNRQWR